MKDSQPSKNTKSQKESPRFPKFLSFLLLLLIALSALLVFFTYKEKKEAGKITQSLGKISEFVMDMDKVSVDRLTANPADLITYTKELQTGAETVKNRLNLAETEAPLHLTKNVDLLSPLGIFDGSFTDSMNGIKLDWDEVSNEITAQEIIKGSNDNLPILKSIADKLKIVNLKVSDLKDKLAGNASLLENLMMGAFFLLVGLLLLLLLLLLSYLYRVLKSKKGDKKEKVSKKPLKEKKILEPKAGAAVKSEVGQKKDLSNSMVAFKDNVEPKKDTALQPIPETEPSSQQPKMPKPDQEISRLKTLLETLFNDQYRPLCIADVDGDILMENEAFKKMSGVDSSETTLQEILANLLPKGQYNKFFSSFQSFFNVDESVLSSLKPIDGVKVQGSDSIHRLTMQPFHTQDGERCSLVSIQEMTQVSSVAPVTLKESVEPEETPTVEVVVPASASVENQKEITEEDIVKPKEDTAINPEIPAYEKSVVEEVKEKTAEVAETVTDKVKDGLAAAAGVVPSLDSDIISPKREVKKKTPFPEKEERKPIKLVDIDHSDDDPFEEEFSTFSILPVITDLSNKLASINGKEIEINTKNFDENIIPENIKPVILETLGQAVKFSIPHSVEPKDMREKAGKNPVADIILSNKYEDSIPGLEKPGVVFYYKDDGRGIDPVTILEVARKAKLTNKKTADELTKNEILSFLFNNQFNLPKKHALDVVNLVRLKETVVKNLKGKMRLSYQEGESFSFQLLVPTEKE